MSERLNAGTTRSRLQVRPARTVAVIVLSLVMGCTEAPSAPSSDATAGPLLGYAGAHETFEICTPRTASPFLVAPVHTFGHPAWAAEPPAGTVITVTGIDSSSTGADVVGVHLVKFDSRILVPDESGQLTFPPLAFPLDSYDGALRSPLITMNPPEAVSVVPLPGDVELDSATTYSVVAVLDVSQEGSKDPVRFQVTGLDYTAGEGSFSLPANATTTIRDTCS